MAEGPSVELTVPAVARYVRLARLTAASLAADAGLDVDAVEDLRVAVNELYAMLIEGAEDDDDVVRLTFQALDDCVVVEGNRPLNGRTEPVELDELAREILAVVSDEHSFDTREGARRFRLVKRGRAGVG